MKMKWLDPKTYPIPKYRTAIFYVKKVWIPPFQPFELLDTEVTDYEVITGLYNPDCTNAGILDLTSEAMYPETDWYCLEDVIAWMPLPSPPNEKYKKDLEIERLQKEVHLLRKLIEPNNKDFFEKMKEIREEYNQIRERECKEDN